MLVPKKFLCARCGLMAKRHDYLHGAGLCRSCDYLVGEEATEARKLEEAKLPIPDRLMYLYTSKHLTLKEE